MDNYLFNFIGTYETNTENKKKNLAIKLFSCQWSLSKDIMQKESTKSFANPFISLVQTELQMYSKSVVQLQSHQKLWVTKLFLTLTSQITLCHRNLKINKKMLLQTDVHEHKLYCLHFACRYQLVIHVIYRYIHSYYVLPNQPTEIGV